MKPIILTFTHEQIQVLNIALVELPYRISSPLINNINQQIKEQIKEQQSLEFDERGEKVENHTQA